MYSSLIVLLIEYSCAVMVVTREQALTEHVLCAKTCRSLYEVLLGVVATIVPFCRWSR